MVVGAATLAVGIVLWWADSHLFDTEAVLHTTDDVLTSPAVQALLPADYFLWAVVIGVNVVLAVSLNVVNGFTGQFSLGHAGFMAVGAYTAAKVSLALAGMKIAEVKKETYHDGTVHYELEYKDAAGVEHDGE